MKKQRCSNLSLFRTIPVLLCLSVIFPFFTAFGNKPYDLTINCNDIYQPVFVDGEGAARILVSDGIPPYVIDWTGPESGSGMLVNDGNLFIDDLPIGEYLIEVTDVQGNLQTCAFELVNPECDLEFELVGFQPACAGTATGVVTFTLPPNSPSVDLMWVDDPNRQFDIFGINALGAVGLPAGTYAVQLTSPIGCVFIDSVTIVDPPVLTLSCENLTLPTTPNSNDGSISPVITGGALPYLLSWTGPNAGDTLLMDPTNYQLSGLGTGVYQMQVTDDNGCTSFCSFVMGGMENCNLSLSLEGMNPFCGEEQDGQISIIINGGVPPFTFDWSDDSYDGLGGAGLISGMSEGVYELIITDAEGCQAASSVQLVAPEAYFVTCSAAGFPTNANATDGEIFVNINDGPGGPYTITYDNHAGTSGSFLSSTGFISYNTIFDLDEGIYDISIENPNGCVTTCSVDLNIPDCEANLVDIPLESYISPSCFGDADGQISLVVREGDPDDYLFDWNVDAYDGQTTLLNVQGGIYSVTVTAPNGCVEVLNGIGIPDPMPVLLACGDTINPSTIGGTDGGNDLYIAGGVPPYILTWAGPSSDQVVTIQSGRFPLAGLEAGTYSVTLEDSNNCFSTCSFFLNDPVVTCDLTLTCNENGIGEGQGPGSYTFTIDGGTGPYNLQLSGLIDINFTLDNPAPWNSNVLPGGDWTFSVVDANGCTEVCNFTVVEPCSLSGILNNTHESCAGANDGAISSSILDGTPPFQYNWNTGASTPSINNLSPGLYRLTLTDGNDCTNILTVTVLAGDALTEGFVNETLCPGDAITVGNQTFDEATPSGTVILTNVDGCDSTVNVSLEFLESFEVEYNAELCAGESITVGGEVFDESTPIGSVTLLSTTGCDSTVNVSLEFIETFEVDYNTELCAGESITVGGEVFDENTPSGSVTLLSTTGCDSTVNVSLEFLESFEVDYNVELCGGESITVGGEVFDENTPSGSVTLISTTGCDSTVNVSLEFLEAFEVDYNAELCAGESLTVGGEVFDENMPIGSVTLISTTGCDSTVSVSLEFLEAFEVDYNAELCAGESITVGSEIFNENTPSGIVTLLSTTGCDSTVNVSLEFLESFEVAYNAELCAGESLTVGSEVFDENTPNGSVTLLSTTGCDSVINVDITFATPIVELRSENNFAGYDIRCIGEIDGQISSTVIQGTPPYNYSWNSGATTPNLNGLGAGTYTLTVTDSNGCATSESLTLQSPTAIQVFATGIVEGCGEEAVQQIRIDSIKGGSGSYEFSIDDQSYFAASSFPAYIDLPASSTEVNLYVQDINDCSQVNAVLIPEINLISVILPEQETLRLGDSLLLEPELGFVPQSWKWTPQAGLTKATELSTFAAPATTTTYTLEITDEAGCTVRAQITIFVNERSAVYFPSAFSPNGDDINDVFMPFGDSDLISIERFEVYDRWGGLLFREEDFPVNDPAFGWDGSFRGQQLNAGTFVYYAEVRVADGKTRIEKGMVALIR